MYCVCIVCRYCVQVTASLNAIPLVFRLEGKEQPFDQKNAHFREPERVLGGDDSRPKVATTEEANEDFATFPPHHKYTHFNSDHRRGGN